MKNNLNNYRIYGDISGNISNEDFFIGVIIFNEKFRKKFLDEFQKKFPNLKNFKKKGTTLTTDKLTEIIEFMNEKRINMICLHFTKNQMINAENLVKTKIKALTGKDYNISFFRERILGILYYYAFKIKTFPKYIYEGNICMETQIKIDKVLSKLSSISHRDNYQFYLSPNWRRLQHLLKFADFVASSGRRIDKTVLTKYPYFCMVCPEIDEYDLDLIFGINKLKDDIKKKNKKKKFAGQCPSSA